MTNLLPPNPTLQNSLRWGLLQLLCLLLCTGISQALPKRIQDVLKREVTLQCQGQRLAAVLNQIEANAEVTFVFSSKLIQPERLVSLNARNENNSPTGKQPKRWYGRKSR